MHTLSPACSLGFRIHLFVLVIPATILPVFLYARLFYVARRIQKHAAKVSEGEAARKIQQRERKTSYFLLAFHHGSRVHTSKCTDCDYSYDHIFQIGWISASYAIYLRSGILRCDIHMTITDPLVIMRNERAHETDTSLRYSEMEPPSP